MAAKLIIERMSDWSYGAFLTETDASCIAVGFTEEEARENGERELKRRTQECPDCGLPKSECDAEMV
jgi:hypothetical protein